jgi:hypothetical protein
VWGWVLGARQPFGFDDEKPQCLRLPRGGTKRRMVVDAQVAFEPDDGAGRHGKYSTEPSHVVLGVRAMAAMLGWAMLAHQFSHGGAEHGLP